MKINEFPNTTTLSDTDLLLVQTANDGAYKNILVSDLKNIFDNTRNNDSGNTTTSGGTSVDNTTGIYSGISFAFSFSSDFSDNTGKHKFESVGSPIISAAQYKTSNKSLYLDGNSYLYTPLSNSLVFGSQPFTWESWIYIPKSANPSNANNMCILGNAYGGQSGNAGCFLAVNNGYLIMRHWIDGNSNATSLSTINADTWHYVAGTRKGTNLDVFLDGIKGSPGSIELTNSDYQFNIGTVPNNAGYASNFVGYMGSTSVYNNFALYSANFTVPRTPY